MPEKCPWDRASIPKFRHGKLSKLTHKVKRCIREALLTITGMKHIRADEGVEFKDLLVKRVRSVWRLRGRPGGGLNGCKQG